MEEDEPVKHAHGIESIKTYKMCYKIFAKRLQY